MKQLWKAALVAIVESKYMIRICAGHVLKALSCFSLMQFRVAAMSDGGIKHKAKVPSFCPRACVRAAMKIESTAVMWFEVAPPPQQIRALQDFGLIFIIPEQQRRPSLVRTSGSRRLPRTLPSAPPSRETTFELLYLGFLWNFLRGTHTPYTVLSERNLHLQPYTLL